MKFERTDSFKRDFRRLSPDHQTQFKKAARVFHDGAVRAAAGKDKPWPNSMRVKTVQGARGVWEMTWSMNDPDGRATWEWTEIDGEPAIRWRRVGDHNVFGNP